MFSSPSYSEWTKLGEVGEGANRGDTFYVDFTRIKKVEGYVYFWSLFDNLRPAESGSLSSKSYYQGDCKLFRFKVLSFFYYKESMGRGTRGSFAPPDNWHYPSPNSSGEIILKSVCSR